MHESCKNLPTVSLILPAWNEAEAIAPAVVEADHALSRITSEYEIIVVDDGSADETAEIVETLSMTHPHLRLIRHAANRGYGAAIRSGFAAADKDLVVFTDADCQFDLNELDRFVLLSDHYDIVCGYRIDRKDTPLRCLYSKVYNLMVRALLGIEVRDVDCALKMFHRPVAKRLRIEANGFLVNSEMLTQAKQLGCSIVEVGVSHRARSLGESTVSAKHIPRVICALVRYWWNQVQFPPSNAAVITDPSKPGFVAPSAAPYRLLQWALLLIAAIFVFANLGYPLIDRDETRYAEIPREMIATGDWVLPQLNFQTYYDKPPMLYWLCAVSFKVFGISERSARLVPALAALATLASTMCFGSRMFGRRIGFLSGVVLMGSVGFAFTSRYLLIDGVLALFISLSLFTAYEAIRTGRLKIGWWMVSGACVGLAFLTKGPIAIVLWLPPVFAMSWLSETHAKPRGWHYGLLGLVVAVVAGPWLMMVHQRDPSFLVEFFYRHNVARFAGEFHPKPWWFFVPVLLVAGHPWSFLSIPYIGFLIGRPGWSRAGRTPEVGYLLLWSGWCVLFFSMSSCKLPTYVLPAAPAFALMVGQYLNEVLRGSSHADPYFFARFWSARMATATTCLGGVAFVLFLIFSLDQLSVVHFGWAMLWTTMLITSLLLLADHHQAKIAWGTSACVAFVFSVMVMHLVVPAYSRSKTLFGESSSLAKQLNVDKRTPIATIDHEFSEVPFYLRRADIANFAGEHDCADGLGEFVSRSGCAILIVDDDTDPSAMLARLPAKAKLIEMAHRGSATIYQATTIPDAQIASTRDPTSDQAQR